MIHPRPLLGEASRDDRPYLALNMVATADGRAAVNGSAVGIGSPADKHLMRELRAEADVVLHGAGTVRADPLSARVPAEMVQIRLSQGLSAQPLGYESPTVIYVTSDHRVEVDSKVVEVCHIASIEEAIADLQRRGARRILCEGGPTLNTALLQAEKVDEIFLTIAPKILGGEDPLTIVKGSSLGTIHLELRSLVELDGELFLKYGVLPKA